MALDDRIAAGSPRARASRRSAAAAVEHGAVDDTRQRAGGRDEHWRRAGDARAGQVGPAAPSRRGDRAGGASATVQVYEYTGGLTARRDEIAGDRGAAGGGARAWPARRRVRRGAAPVDSAPDLDRARRERRVRCAAGRVWGFMPMRRAGSGSDCRGDARNRPRERRDRPSRARAPGRRQACCEWVAPRRALPHRRRSSRASGGREVGVSQRWPVRTASARAGPATPVAEPLVTGQRVIDLLFPVAAGRHGGDPWRVRHGQDGGAAADREVV